MERIYTSDSAMHPFVLFFPYNITEITKFAQVVPHCNANPNRMPSISEIATLYRDISLCLMLSGQN